LREIYDILSEDALNYPLYAMTLLSEGLQCLELSLQKLVELLKGHVTIGLSGENSTNQDSVISTSNSIAYKCNFIDPKDNMGVNLLEVTHGNRSSTYLGLFPP